MCSSHCYAPPPLFSAKLRFKRGGVTTREYGTDVGCNGRISNGGVFRNCDLHKELEEKRLNIPNPTPLPGTHIPFPYMIVADDAFPLKKYIMKPFNQIGLTPQRRIYNYRLSRARRVVKNAFGILANRFRVFMTPIGLVPEKVEVITIIYVHV